MGHSFLSENSLRSFSFRNSFDSPPAARNENDYCSASSAYKVTAIESTHYDRTHAILIGNKKGMIMSITTLRNCACKSPWMDHRYGSTIRVMNHIKPDKTPAQFRCTVCGKERD